MTALWLTVLLIVILLVKHFFLWHPVDVSHLYRHGPLKIGHRGSPKVAPENTIPSYLKAVESRLEAIELDVLSTSDGKVVCSHNHDLERETDGYGYIKKMTYAELAGVDAGIKFPAYSPCNIPLLEEVLDIIPENVVVNIEIKSEKPFDLRTARHVVNIIRERNLYHRVLVSSFHPLTIGRIKWLDRRIPTAYVWDNENVPDILKKPRFIDLVHPDMFHPAVHLVNENLVRFARRKGLRVNVWTVNNQPAMEWLFRLRVDGIISDFPELMHRAAAKMGGENDTA
ncbi:MAG: glycerophosphodiester phosphodiesterase [Fidelibacterota bacterium]